MLKWYHPNALLRLEGAAHLIRGRLSAILGNAYATSGISPLEGNVLAIVASSTTPLTVPQVARTLGNSRQAIQRAAMNLKSVEMLQLSKNPHHKRSSLLNITDKGLAVLQKASEEADALMTPILARLDAGKVSRLAKELAITLSEIEDAILEVDGEAE